MREGQYGPYDSSAGFVRNEKMIDYADAVIALQPNGDSSGTQDMVDKAKKKGLSVFIFPERNERESEYCYEF